jgi:inositol transporter-like SP family MFS transporter
MASYLDAATLVAGSIAFVFYKQAGFPIGALPMGALSALLTLGIAVGSLIGGRLGDRFGRRRVFAIDLAIFVFGLALLTFATGLPMLFAGAAVAGLAMGADLPVSITLVAEAAPVGYKGRMVSLTQLLWLLGIAGSLLTSNIVGWLGLGPELSGRIMFGHILVIAVLVWLLRLRVPESTEWVRAAGQEPSSTPTGGVGLRAAATKWRGYLPAVAATGLFYLFFNFQANTNGQFGTYLFTEIAGGDISVSNLIGLLTFPLGIAAALGAMAVVDTPHRMRFFAGGGALVILAVIPAAIFGATISTMLIVLVVPQLAAAFCGEALYKVWTQELFPTLLRSTAQGLTIFLSRAACAGFALITPLLAESSPNGLFWVLAGSSTIAYLIGLFWIGRLPKQPSEGPPQPQEDSPAAIAVPIS